MWSNEATLQFVAGAIVMGFGIAGLFFLRFWRQTRDRLFLIFAFSFWFLGGQRLALAVNSHAGENHIEIYLIRLLAFILILVAIIDKNRSRS